MLAQRQGRAQATKATDSESQPEPSRRAFCIGGLEVAAPVRIRCPWKRGSRPGGRRLTQLSAGAGELLGTFNEPRLLLQLQIQYRRGQSQATTHDTCP